MCYCSAGFSEYMRHRDRIKQQLCDPEPERLLHRLRREQRTEQIRIPIVMENTEEQDFGIEQDGTTEKPKWESRKESSAQASYTAK